MPITPRCHALCCSILYLFTTESPTHFSFFLNKPLNCLWFIYPNFERYRFPAESSLTLDLWNKAIFLFFLTVVMAQSAHSNCKDTFGCAHCFCTNACRCVFWIPFCLDYIKQQSIGWTKWIKDESSESMISWLIGHRNNGVLVTGRHQKYWS